MNKRGSQAYQKKKSKDDSCCTKAVQYICSCCCHNEDNAKEESGNMGNYDEKRRISERRNRSCTERFRDFLSEICCLQDYQERELGLPTPTYDKPDYDGFNDVRTPVLGSPTKSYSTSPMTSPSRRFVVEAPPFTFKKHNSIPIGTRVRFVDNEEYRGGTVVWTGYRTEQLVGHGLNNIFIVVRVDEYHSSACTDAIFEGQRLIDSVDGSYVMLKHTDIKFIPSFEFGDYCVIVKRIGEDNRMFFEGGFFRKTKTSENDIYYILEPMNTNFITMSPVEYEKQYRDYVLQKAPPPECDPVSDYVEAIGGLHFDKLLGRNKGIQGFRNSCYLDTLLFSFFAFSNDLDELLTVDNEADHEFFLVLNVIRYNIVYPLRASHFVSHQHVGELRRLMASQINDKFRAENRDIPECMDALFGQLLRVKPMLSIGRATDEEAFFDGAYMAECIQVDNARIPTSKLLLENAAIQMDFCIEKMPKCFMLQLPRDSERDGYILPSYKLDLKNLLYRSVKVCNGCFCNATLQFPILMNTKRDIAATFLCEDCAKAANLDLSMSKRIPKPDLDSILDEDTELKMSALICIERSHYNCFVRCGERWVFFDSMNDQSQLLNPVTKEYETFNIPIVEEVPDFQKWLSDAQRCVNTSGSLNNFFSSLTGSNKLKAERVFRYPYNIIYRPTSK